MPVEGRADVRVKLWEWMRSPDNPYFARSFVNRVWAHYFGVGLVDPVDNFSIANPPTNARLLNALAKDFIDHNFDIRELERTILNTRTYQLSARPNDTNTFDKNNFARSYVRPLMAEAVVDVFNAALGVTETFGPNDAPPGRKMIEVGSSRIQNGNLSYVLRIFGRPPRTAACDCERTQEPALPQTLFRMTDPAVIQKLNAPNGRLAQLLRDRSKTDEEVFEELFLACLSRFPSPEERAAFVEHRARESRRPVAFQDTLWALINTREFIPNQRIFPCLPPAAPTAKASTAATSLSSARLAYSAWVSPTCCVSKRARPAAPASGPSPSSWSGWPAARPPSTCGILSRTPPTASAARSRRSPPPPTASRSANTCRRWRR